MIQQQKHKYMIPNSNYIKYYVPVAGQYYTTSPLVPSKNTLLNNIINIEPTIGQKNIIRLKNITKKSSFHTNIIYDTIVNQFFCQSVCLVTYKNILGQPKGIPGKSVWHAPNS